MERALFLDRDGVVNVEIDYAYLPAQITFMPGIFELCRRAHAAGEKIIIVTNQSGIGRGFYSEADFHALMAWMKEKFTEEGAPLTAYYFCPHLPEDGCACRKPKPGMIVQAAKDWNIDLGNSRLLGDKQSDIEAGTAAGIIDCCLVEGRLPLE
ncbi:MAG: HAD family hydrolase [Alphaproteobacteria bacterium]|nr:HAD family hydrolase [Alphaproteobacteria bacterium]